LLTILKLNNSSNKLNNMFNYKHYVPILRWKAAERGALLKLKSDDKTNITPLIEFIMPQPDDDEGKKTPKDLLQESINVFMESIPNIADQILKHWGYDAIFIDVQFIDGSIRAEALEKILSHGKQLNLFMIPVITIIPVIGFESDAKTRHAAIKFAKESGNGLCSRITESNFNEKSLADDIKNFIIKNALVTRNVDLLVDFKIIDQLISCDSFVAKINKIPHLKEWRTFIVAGGAFPKDLSHLEKHNQHKISRADWAIWKMLLSALKRPPSFADYTIQHPVYMPQTSSATNPSASIRYALEDYWLIERGEGLRNPKGAGFKQYPALANILAKQKIFKGEEFSYGDSYIAEKAKDINTKKTGNPKTWLEAGINHHVTLVVNQIANLP